MWYDSFLCVTWLIRMCDMTNSYVWHMCDMTYSCVFSLRSARPLRRNLWLTWHDSFMCVTWLMHCVTQLLLMRDKTHSCAWHDSFLNVTWMILTCSSWGQHALSGATCDPWDMTPSCVWHDIHTCDTTHSYVWRDSFSHFKSEADTPSQVRLVTRKTWLIRMCDMTHSYVWHDSFICVTWLIHLCDMTHSYVWHDSFVCVSWLIQRPCSSLKRCRCLCRWEWVSERVSKWESE